MKKLLTVVLFLNIALYGQTELTIATKECLKKASNTQDIEECISVNQPKTEVQEIIENLKKKTPACKGISTLDMEECASIEEKVYDEILNKEYKEAMNGLKVQKIKNNLKDAQRKWIAYRDAKCIAEHPLPMYNNTETLGHSYCLINTIKQRAEELANIVENLEYYNRFTFLDKE